MDQLFQCILHIENDPFFKWIYTITANEYGVFNLSLVSSLRSLSQIYEMGARSKYFGKDLCQ